MQVSNSGFHTYNPKQPIGEVQISRITKHRNETLTLGKTNPLSSGIKIPELRYAKYELVHMQKQSSDAGLLEFRKTKFYRSYLLGASSLVLSFYL
jgi:hypothetical protein